MYINFSDAAKYADIARNLVGGLGYGNSFTFWSTNIFDLIEGYIFSSAWTPPVVPYSIATFFKIFGVGDFAVIATSFFYFLMTLIFVYLLGKKVFGSKLVGALSTFAVGFNYDLIHYATNGASESPFIFEIVAASYFVSIKKRWANVATIILFILMFFTRPQAFIYIIGIVLFWLLLNIKSKKVLMYFAGIIIVGLLVDYFVLLPNSGKNFIYSIIGRGYYTSRNQTSTASDVLRGATNTIEAGLAPILKNIFYNLYNFYKLLPKIISPYLFGLFVIGLLHLSHKAPGGQVKLQSAFKIATVFMVAATFLVTAVSIPFFRYLHPITPLVYVLAVGTLVSIISKLQTRSKTFIILASTSLILLFGVGQTLGVLILDSRFERDTHNARKPPVYVELSKILKENTDSNQVVITNLDTWGSWYGERRTVWYPIEPKQIINPATGKIPFDAIYLTSYLTDDANYYMGDSWRMIFDDPDDPKKWICDGCSEIADEFDLKGVYEISANSNYEKQDASAVLLIKK